jgi:tetratricopeptide (TPR) repeat protein
MSKKYIRFLLFAGILAALPIVMPKAFSANAQGRNSISVQVYGHTRQPLADIQVELLDDYGGSIKRGRTNGSGFVMFSGLSANVYKVRVRPYGTDYEEQEQTVEIVNITRSDGNGGTFTSGTQNEERDFYLRLRKGVDPLTGGVIFAQDVPAKAKKLYEQALDDLQNKKRQEAFEKLKSALEIFPDYFNALDRLGTEYVRGGFYAPATVLLELAAKVNARSYNSWYMLAYSFHALKRYDDSSNAVEKALELETAPGALLLSGVLLRRAKRFEDAEKRLLKARELARDTMPVIHRELGALYGYDLKRYAEAVKELKAYLKGSPDLKDAEDIKKLIVEFEEKAQLPKLSFLEARPETEVRSGPGELRFASVSSPQPTYLSVSPDLNSIAKIVPAPSPLLLILFRFLHTSVPSANYLWLA